MNEEEKDERLTKIFVEPNEYFLETLEKTKSVAVSRTCTQMIIRSIAEMSWAVTYDALMERWTERGGKE